MRSVPVLIAEKVRSATEKRQINYRRDMAIGRKKEFSGWILSHHADGTITKGELEQRMHFLDENWEKLLMDGMTTNEAR